MTGYKSKRAAAQDKLDSMEREALKLALEALENLYDTCDWHGDDGREAMLNAPKAITAIKEALAQPEQEPWPEEPFGHMAGGIQPPQRPWVGLTAEEAAECWTTSATHTWRNFEAKLKEKNT